MPFDCLSSADGAAACADPTCRGAQPRRVSVELRLSVWTRRIGDGPVQVSRSQKVPFTLPENALTCEYCGGPTVLTGAIAPGLEHLQHWPDPSAAIKPTTVADEVLPVVRPPTVEERLHALE